MHLEETERLLDAYLAALAGFYDAHHPPLWRWLRRDSKRAAQEASARRLTEARFNYWMQIEIYDAVATAITCAQRTPASQPRLHVAVQPGA